LKLQEKIDVAEDSVEFKDEDKVFRLWGDYPLEQQALDVYTHPIYLRGKLRPTMSSMLMAKILMLCQLNNMFTDMVRTDIGLRLTWRLKLTTASVASLTEMVCYVAIFLEL
jgi:hypothetical protein